MVAYIYVDTRDFTEKMATQAGRAIENALNP